MNTQKNVIKVKIYIKNKEQYDKFIEKLTKVYPVNISSNILPNNEDSYYHAYINVSEAEN